MKLFVFFCGNIKMKKGIFTPGFDEDKVINTPVPIYLIEHPQGNVIFDTGFDPVIVENPIDYWGGVAKAFWPSLSQGQEIIRQLSLSGYIPADITHVIVSHFHMDHAGGNKYFPGAQFIVQDVEHAEAIKPENEGKGYYKRDWDHPLNYKMISGTFDVFGDGKIILEHLPGHSVGQQIAIVDLINSGKIVLASDAAPMLENLNNQSVPKNIWNRKDFVTSIGRLNELQKQGCTVICGHDDRQFETLRIVPEFYD